MAPGMLTNGRKEHFSCLIQYFWIISKTNSLQLNLYQFYDWWCILYDRIDRLAAIIINEFFPFYQHWLASPSRPSHEIFELYDAAHHMWAEGLVCYTLSRSWDSPSSVTILWAVGLRRVHSSVLSVIMIIPFTHPSPNSVPPPFHVSDLRFVSCFRSYSQIPFRSIFNPRTPNPDPDICPFLVTLICSLWYLYVPILMYVPQSEIDIDCPSNSLSEPPNLRSVSRPKFEDSRRLVAQHISWSRVLTKNIEPRYALGPSPALTVRLS